MQAERGEAREVVGVGEMVEVGVDFAFAADACSSPAVSSAHEVPELAFDFGSGGAVVVDPVGVLLLGAGVGEVLFVDPDLDRTPALLGRWAAVATVASAVALVVLVVVAERLLDAFAGRLLPR